MQRSGRGLAPTFPAKLVGQHVESRHPLLSPIMRMGKRLMGPGNWPRVSRAGQALVPAYLPAHPTVEEAARWGARPCLAPRGSPPVLGPSRSSPPPPTDPNAAPPPRALAEEPPPHAGPLAAKPPPRRTPNPPTGALAAEPPRRPPPPWPPPRSRASCAAGCAGASGRPSSRTTSARRTPTACESGTRWCSACWRPRPSTFSSCTSWSTTSCGRCAWPPAPRSRPSRTTTSAASS